MAEESKLPDSPAPDLSDRVDALLSSALADQAREKKQLVDTLYGARAALVKAEGEMGALKQQIAERDEQLLTAIDEKFQSRLETIEEALLQLAKSVAQIPVKVRKDIEVAAVAVGERIGEESDSLLSNFREDAVEVVATLSKLSDKSLAQNQNAIEAAREEYRTTTEQVVKYLGERDDALQRQRDQVLIGLFKQLGESLGKRNSKRIAKGISDPNVGRTPPAPKVKQVPPPYRQAPAFPSPPERSQPIPYQPPPEFPPTEAVPESPGYEPVPLAAPQPPTPASPPGYQPAGPPPPAGYEPPAGSPPPGFQPAEASPQEYVPEEEEIYDIVPVAYGDAPYEEDEIPAQRPGKRRGRQGPEPDYLVRVPAFGASRPDESKDFAGMFGPIDPDPQSKPRRGRKPAQPAADRTPRSPRVTKVPKGRAVPVKRAPRRKPED